MKLNAAQRQKVEEQFGVEAISDENPAIPRLKEVFGDHTFFLDAAGLNVIEADESLGSKSGNVVKLACWNDDQTSLRVQEPEVLDLTVEIGSDDS